VKTKLASSRAEARCEKRGLQQGAKEASQIPNRPGFTLIELLVVIAVIAILAAMLLPALNRAKAQANSAACKNHLHQMGLALQMYVTEWDKYPPYFEWSPPTLTWPEAGSSPGYKSWFWLELLDPYYASGWWSNRSYHCPGYKYAVRGPIHQGYGSDGFPVGSYGYNWIGALNRLTRTRYGAYGLGGFANDVWDMDIPRVPLPQSRVLAPSEMFAIADSRLPFWATGPGDPQGTCVIDIGFNTLALPLHMLSDPLRHGRNYNVVCCDGHVDSMPPHLLFNPTNSAVRWNSDHQEHPEAW
jgi:prepilin-type N-terminal cleavage/methylation domain-containing protein